ncbi:hypothetical protein BH24BAC1_BH24BAC1_17450 [soil metagenome]
MILAWQEQGLSAVYGDAEDPHLPEVLPLENTRFVITSFPDLNTNRSLLKFLRASDYSGKFALTAHTERDGKILTEDGADLILYPFADAAENIVHLFGEPEEVEKKVE